MAPTYYVEDYEALTGKKPDGSVIETKVIAAPVETPVAPAAVAEVQ